MKKMMLFALCVTAVSCGGEPAVQYFERPVKAITVESVSEVTRSFSGTVSPKEESDIGFKMGGEIVELSVKEGQKVKKGDLIAEVNAHDYKVQYAAAEAAYLNSKSQLNRYDRLYKKEAISQQDYEMAQTNYAHTKATYQSASELLKDTKLIAPFNGIIEKRYVNKYQRVQPSEPVVRLINPKILEIDFTLPIKSLDMVEYKETTYKVTFDDYPGVAFNAVVIKIVNSSPDGSGIPVTLEIQDTTFNSDKYAIKSGFSCTIAVSTINPELKGIVAIPLSSIHYDNATKQAIVWRYDSTTNSVNAQSIVKGDLQGSDEVLISEGLAPGDTIVSAGVHQITDGQKVKLVK